MSLAGGDLKICQTNIYQDEKGMYFFLCWSFGLEYIPSGILFQASESIQEGRNVHVHTYLYGLSTCLLWELWHWQRPHLCALHRVLIPVRLASAPLALLPDLCLSVALHKHLHCGISIGSREPQGWTHSRRGQGVALTCSLSAADGQSLSWPTAWPWYARWYMTVNPWPSLPCKKDAVWALASSSCRQN